MNKLGIRFVPVFAAMAIATTLPACGHTDEEMAAKQREIDSLKTNLKASRDLSEQTAAKFNAAQKDIEDLKSRTGAALASSEQEKAKLKQAMAEYEQRLKQLDEMKQRFRDLKARLDKLTAVGLKVVVRNNRMVIQLPGDILFDSGRDDLKPEGKKVLKQVADAIAGDATLRTRTFQVAGHTDNQPYGAGAFKDNWGLSLARARQVLLFLVGAPDAKGKEPAGGGLDPKHWSASGYGETDPQAGSVEKQTNEDRQRNRRVELVLEPNVEEMLNLKEFGG